MRSRLTHAAVAVIVLGVFAAVGTGQVLAARLTIAVVDRDFVAPGGGSTVTVDPGDTVIWRAQNIATDHTVTSGSRTDPASAGKLFAGSFSKTGDRLEYTFGSPGEYPFFCEFHANMNGLVVVRGAAATPAPTTTLEPTATPAASATPIASAGSTPAPSASATASVAPDVSSPPSSGASASPGPPGTVEPSLDPGASPAASGEPSGGESERRDPVSALARFVTVVLLGGAIAVLLGLTAVYRRVNR